MIGRIAVLTVLPSVWLLGQPAPTLAPATPLERQIAGGEAHDYRLALGAGQCAGVAVEQRGVDVVIQILDLQNTLVAEYDAESRSQGREFAVVTADTSGTYQIRIKPVYSRAAGGQYEIRLAEIRAATDDDRLAFESHRRRTEAALAQERGRYDNSIRLFENALDLAEKASMPDNGHISYLLYRIAALNRTVKGEYSIAERQFERAVALEQQTFGREHPLIALTLRGWGTLYLATGDHAKAEPLLQEALEIAEKTLGKVHPEVALCLRSLANLHGYLEDHARARTYLERALPIAEKGFDPDDVNLIAVVHDLANAYFSLKDFDRAEPLLERTVAFVEKKYGAEHMQLAAPLLNLGNVALERKEYERALKFYERAHAIREKAQGTQHPDTARLIVAMANVYLEKGDSIRSLQIYEQALDLLKVSAGPYHRSTSAALDGMARSYAALDDLPRAIEYQTRFDEVQEKQIGWNLMVGSDREKLAYLKWISSQTDRTISLHVLSAPESPAALDLAVLVLLQRKGRGLDAMSGSMAALRQRLNPGDQKLLDELSETDAKLARLSLGGPGNVARPEWEKQIAELEERRERLESVVSGRSNEFRARSQPVTLVAVRAAIPEDAALIEFASYRSFDPKIRDYGKSRYVAYILRRHGEIRWRDVGPADEIDRTVEVLRQALRDDRRHDVRGLARNADRKIMEPLRALAGDAKQLLISPDGDLNLIPFEALVDEQGRYLVERYAITYLTTGRDLLSIRTLRTSLNGPVVVADPFFGEPRTMLAARRRSITIGPELSSMYFAPLPGTAAEAHSIQSLFHDAKILTGRDASKTSLKHLEGPSILHIATHGFYLDESAAASGPGTGAIQARNLDNPLVRSGLALAGANLNNRGDNGVLTALEASGLNLWGTQVVTLSGCETGLGEVKKGEGVYGLRRAFLLAGAQSLVMSLWSVSDGVTQETMTAYYSGLKAGLGRGEALRQAQLAMLRRKQREHPFYWAGFIHSGDWRSLDGK
jgi:CHAT domain-containing protein/Tfp pilus assembly protein PilF